MPVTARSAFHVRSRVNADDTFIERLSRVAFAEYSRNPGATTLQMARAGSTWVAVRGSAPVGFATTRKAGSSSAELCAIAVEEHARGIGVGQALLTQVERALARAGIRNLTLHTAEANSAALELFSKRGFLTARHLPRFYRAMFDACAMHKRLA